MLGWRRTALRKRVIVNTKTDKAFQGTLWAQRGPLLVLKGADLLEGGRVTQMDGEVVIERNNVDFVQVVGGA
jgi:small nuclear ribonucleoprotein (snRNP)-like protein